MVLLSGLIKSLDHMHTNTHKNTRHIHTGKQMHKHKSTNEYEHNYSHIYTLADLTRLW